MNSHIFYDSFILLENDLLSKSFTFFWLWLGSSQLQFTPDFREDCGLVSSLCSLGNLKAWHSYIFVNDFKIYTSVVVDNIIWHSPMCRLSYTNVKDSGMNEWIIYLCFFSLGYSDLDMARIQVVSMLYRVLPLPVYITRSISMHV